MGWFNREKEIIIPTKEMMERGIKYQQFVFNVSILAWIIFFLYGIVLNDMVKIQYAVLLFTAACTFYLSQKIDKIRLEAMEKEKGER